MLCAYCCFFCLFLHFICISFLIFIFLSIHALLLFYPVCSMLADKLNMTPEEAERWIVNLIRNARLDAKIDSKLVRMPRGLLLHFPLVQTASTIQSSETNKATDEPLDFISSFFSPLCLFWEVSCVIRNC